MFNWFSRIITIADYSVTGGKCDRCNETEGISINKVGPRTGQAFVPQRRHRIHFDVRGKPVTRDICTKCRDELKTRTPVTA